MSKNIKHSIYDLIGNTPLYELQAYSRALGNDNIIYAKLEFYNPAGSIKDRVALEMIRDAEQSGKLVKGSTIIEPTSGNTGIGLAAIAVARGYKVIIVMPDSMSVERRKLMCAYGAELVLTPGAEGMKGAIAKAGELADTTPSSFIPGQFVNRANPACHFKTTGPEIWRDTGGEIDYFVAGVGTGGTLTGIGEYLKSMNPDIKIIAVEPRDSAVLSGGKAAPHGLQGIGAGFIPDILNTNIIDSVITVSTDEAYEAARRVAKYEGILIGVSSGAALHASSRVAEKGKKIVTIFPDSGERYLSSSLFDKD